MADSLDMTDTHTDRHTQSHTHIQRDRKAHAVTYGRIQTHTCTQREEHIQTYKLKHTYTLSMQKFGNIFCHILYKTQPILARNGTN